MSLLFKLQNIGFAISVGTLSVLAVNVEPAKADISGDYNTQGNAKEYCVSMKSQNKNNHFWVNKGSDSNDTSIDFSMIQAGNTAVKWKIYQVYRGYVYYVGTMKVDGKKVVQNNVCNTIKKLQPVNVEQQKWAEYRCYGELGCGGGYYYKTMYKLENGNIDLNYYHSSKDGSVSRKTYKNFSYITW